VCIGLSAAVLFLIECFIKLFSTVAPLVGIFVVLVNTVPPATYKYADGVPAVGSCSTSTLVLFVVIAIPLSDALLALPLAVLNQ